MKIAVIGSRTLTVRNLEKYIPKDTTEIISGGANGIDRCAKEFAVKNNIRYTEFLPEYKIHGRYAPLKRNLEIIDNADFVLAFWDGKSRGTKFVIDNCRKINKPIRVLISKGCILHSVFVTQKLCVQTKMHRSLVRATDAIHLSYYFFKSYTIGNHIGTTVLKIRTEQIPQVKPKIIPAITSVR